MGRSTEYRGTSAQVLCKVDCHSSQSQDCMDFRCWSNANARTVEAVALPMWQCACSNFFLRQSKVMTECACHRLGFLASTWWVMACSPVISTQLALVKWMPASFRSIRESWRMSGKNYLTQITSKFWLWADASVFQLLQGLLKQAKAVWQGMLVNASSHARSRTKGHVLQRTTEVHSGEAASWCFLRDSVLASEGKRAVASDGCCQLFTLYLFTKVPWTGNATKSWQ